MGIEPTGAAFIATPNGFENRGHHQVCKHFRPCFCWFLSTSRFGSTLFVLPLYYLSRGSTENGGDVVTVNPRE